MSEDSAEMFVRQLFAQATSSVLPHVRLQKLLRFDSKDRILHVESGKSYALKSDGCIVVGFGKAVIGMAAELQRILGNQNISKMILSVPVGITCQVPPIQLPKLDSKVSLIEGAKDNIPDLNSLKAAKMISDSLDHLSAQDLVIVLVSGGGSALLPAPKDPLSLEDKAKITKELSRSGASIQELNQVRIQLSSLKGGKLAAKCKPANVLGLILSDIIDDPLELISSGPTVLNDLKDVSAYGIISKYGIEVSPEIKKVLDTPSDLNESVLEFKERVGNVLIGNNRIALKTCLNHAKSQGFSSFELTHQLSGEARQVGAAFGALAFYLCQENRDLIIIENLINGELKLNIDKEIIGKMVNQRPICLVAGGETTVKVTGNGKGGRNQEMVLAALIKYHELSKMNAKTNGKFTFLSAGTDGIDGPTDVAGAVCDQDTCLQALEQGLDPLSFLEINDSYNFFKSLSKGQNFIKTGHTGTNVMDLQILIIT